jgi:hypothetical protein
LFRRTFSCCLIALACALFALGVWRPLCAEAPQPAAPRAKSRPVAKSVPQSVSFEKQVVPILLRHCSGCHNPSEHAGGLNLLDRDAALAGGKSGEPAIKPGDLDDSYLITRIEAGEMPPAGKGQPLTAGELADLRRWIESGAAWPKSRVISVAETVGDVGAGRDWWSLKPPVRPALPAVKYVTWIRTPIDAFVLAKLESKGLKPSPRADRRTLIRRLSFDLLGLPPTPEEVAAFVADPDPVAYEKLVDRYLASPHYGERWAGHWLDIAHYADTHGFERDQRRDNAYHYRDYVIRALNADKPYDEFLREQIAGDVLKPTDAEAVAATGFLAAGPWDYVGQVETTSGALRRAAQADDLDDMVTQVIAGTCGLTINCARCHDHKLDPISQRDYYSLWAVFAGVQRGDRELSAGQGQKIEAVKRQIREEQEALRARLARRDGQHYDLADIVGGGNGLGTGVRGNGIDPLSGHRQVEKRGILAGIKVNHFTPSTVKFVDGVFIPGASADGAVVSSTGLRVKGIPATTAQAWDAIRSGPVNSQFTTTLGGIDFGAADHTLLALHANAAITFDLAKLRAVGAPAALRFTTSAGYFGSIPRRAASFFVYLDGQLKAKAVAIGHDDGIVPVEVAIDPAARFLTLISTDDSKSISYDQICFGDPWLLPQIPPQQTDLEKAELASTQRKVKDLEEQLKALGTPAQVYAVRSEAPPVIHMLHRGNPEDPAAEVTPGAIACVGLPVSLGTNSTPEGQRRVALAQWITQPANPLTRRVIVNRLWHYHFGVGLVDTPSDFGHGGSLPSHPELLDWLAGELLNQKWSLKAMHRLICTSATYQQASLPEAGAMKIDAGNRLLWRMNPQRLEAEDVRDAVLFVSGKLNPTMYGPGYQDFDYQEEYAPVYRYIVADKPELWRRTIYRFVVRTTPSHFLTTLDCPNPANLTPARNVTTTALQSLALLNNEFMLKQAGYFADRVRAESSAGAAAQVARAFALAFGRSPTADEAAAGVELIKKHGLPQFCRMLLNANEFVYVD